MLNEILPGIASHLLSQAEWARRRLAEHAGKQLRVDLLLGSAVLRIGADGDVQAGDPHETADLVITLTPVAAAQWLTDREAGWRQARVEGDMDLAAAISYVMANLRWDYEEDLSRVVGDIAAHRIAHGARRLSAWPKDAMESAAKAFAEFVSEERQLLTTPLRFEHFANEVDELRDAVERLDKRLVKLAQHPAESAQH